MNRPIAFFDFDGTLTHSDSLRPFLRLIRGTHGYLYDLFITSPWLLGYATKLIRNDVAKEALLTQAFRGRHIEELLYYGNVFASEHIPRMIRKDTMALLEGHKHKGHCCVLVSASLDLYLKPWCKANGFDYCLSSSLEVVGAGKITGRLSGNNCFGLEKVARIQRLLNEIGRPTYSYGYGDSKGDIPMLSIMDKGMMV